MTKTRSLTSEVVVTDTQRKSTIRPLDGVRVLDFTRHMAGPYATVFLADYGADIIKVESLPNGDPSRSTGVRVGGIASATFLMWNRGKRSLALDLRTTEAVEAIHRLVHTADVVVENYRPGVADTIGIGYATLSALNPRIIYASLSAFGSGEMAAYPGTDPVIQAVSGVMSVTGEADRTPVLVGVPMADFTGAMTLGQAVLLGLLARDKTGRGQRIDISMLNAMLFSLSTRLASYWATGEIPRRNGGAHSVVMPYQVFRTADGYVVAGVWNGANVMWPLFCDAVGLPELAADARYATNELRLANATELGKRLSDQFFSRTSDEWEVRFHERGVLFGKVNTFRDVLETSVVKDSGIVGTVKHSMLGPIPQLGPVISLADTPGSLSLAPPLLGEHTVEVLREGGLSPHEIAHMTALGLALDGSISSERDSTLMPPQTGSPEGDPTPDPTSLDQRSIQPPPEGADAGTLLTQEEGAR